MTIGQNLEALRVQLGSLYRESRNLVQQSPFAPSPSVQSAKYDNYLNLLNAIERRLKTLESSFGRLKQQGPGYQGKEDPYRAKQRDASFQDQVDSIEKILKECLDALADLVSPNKRGAVKGIVDLGKKADEILKQMKTDKVFLAELGQKGGPHISAPAQGAPIDASVTSVLTIAIVVVAGLKKLVSRKDRPA